jgi:uncharacterized protein YqfA (UPF0365 family)
LTGCGFGSAGVAEAEAFTLPLRGDLTFERAEDVGIAGRDVVEKYGRPSIGARVVYSPPPVYVLDIIEFQVEYMHPN